MDDAGNAVVEFVFVALVVMVPLIYLIVLFATIQRDQLGVTTAAREAGRAFATADTSAAGTDRARVAAAMAYEDAGLDGPVKLTFVAAGRQVRVGHDHPHAAGRVRFRRLRGQP